MDISRREFLKLIGFSSGCFFIDASLPLSKCFCKHRQGIKIKVIGTGDLGCSVISHIIEMGLNGVEFIQLPYIKTPLDYEERRIRKYLKNSDTVFIVAGMGGFTGTELSPLIAKVSKELGAWTIGIVTLPFRFEGKKRLRNAQRGIEKIKEASDITVLIQNDAISKIVSRPPSFCKLFRKLVDTLSYAVRSFSNTLLTPHMLSISFEDIKKMFPNGLYRIGIGEAKKDGIKEAVQEAICSPLLEGVSFKRTKTVMCTMMLTGKETIGEINKAVKLLQMQLHKGTQLIWDTIMDKREKAFATLITSCNEV